MASINATTNALKPTGNGTELNKLLTDMLADIQALQTNFNALRTSFNAHTHGGVTTGAGTSAAPTATGAAAVTLKTTS